jgi:hypothetical protein
VVKFGLKWSFVRAGMQVVLDAGNQLVRGEQDEAPRLAGLFDTQNRAMVMGCVTLDRVSTTDRD